MLDLVDLKARGREPAAPSPRRRSPGGCARRVARSSSRSCAAKSTTSKRAARREHARRLGDRGGRRVGVMQHLVDDDAVGAAVVERQAHTCRPGAGSTRMPAASSFTRARRSISDERSMPIAWLARGPNSSIIRPVPVPMSTSRPSGRSPSARSMALLDLAFGDVERADLVPDVRRGRRNSGWRPRRARRGSRSVRAASAANKARVASSAQSSISANIGSSAVSGRQASGTPSFLPCGARARRHRRGSSNWRDTRGWLWPSTCASSPTDSSIDPQQARGCAAASGRRAPGNRRRAGEPRSRR